MGTSMRLIETFNESTEREQIQALFKELMQIEDNTVTHVQLIVKTVNPDGTENDKRVTWRRSRLCKYVEE